ncbi:hypothetical protein O1611_g2703 [Lasiodiplodia mahajangana]|uniref:Uncharacterized protein n=1 Tax=Lasiodiplodia mahajangana TaxID=1108764 RepID=A0ACC2JTS7_9PEZI|nr:hypothetical protein O1611_g2703 [Lasiodiplodia mahajangana]
MNNPLGITLLPNPTMELMAASSYDAIPAPLKEGGSRQLNSSYKSMGSPYATASSSSTTSTNNRGRGTPKKGPGRPPTARRIWQQQVMKRRLIRLYLYTPESILNTKQISQLISEVARLEELKRRYGVFTAITENVACGKTNVYSRHHAGLSVPLSNCTHVQTETRSTQYELQKLLWDGYRQYRPRNLGEARKRIKAFRLIRHGRVSKHEKSQASHHKRDDSRPGSTILSELALSTVAPLFPGRSECHRYHPYHRTESRVVRNNALDSDQQSLKTFTSDSRSYIRLSWVREKFENISRQSLRSSFYSDIRSLLSKQSLRSSFASRQSAAIATGIDVSPITHDVNIPPTDKSAKLIQLCCRYRKNCIHRKFLQTASPQSLPAELENGGLNQKDFTMQYGRDFWNRTAFHLAAEWAPDELSIPLILYFLNQRPCECQSPDSSDAGQHLDKCEHPYHHRRAPDLLNVKNIDGETFMHVLSRRWRTLVFPPDVTATSFCSLVIAEGFDLDSRDGLERTFFSGLIDQMRYLSPQTEAERLLQSISWKLSVPLSEAGLPSDAFEFVYDILQDTDFRNLLFILQIYQKMSEMNEEINAPNSWEGENIRQLLAGGCPNFSTVIADRNVDINEYDKCGRTPLTALIDGLRDSASQGNDAPTCEQIKDHISRKPDLNLVDSRGNTPLHYAVQAGFPQVVQALIDAGVNTSARNLDGVSAMELAAAQYEGIARPSSKDFSVAYARAHGVLVRLFDSDKDGRN